MIRRAGKADHQGWEALGEILRLSSQGSKRLGQEGFGCLVVACVVDLSKQFLESKERLPESVFS